MNASDVSCPPGSELLAADISVHLNSLLLCVLFFFSTYQQSVVWCAVSFPSILATISTSGILLLELSLCPPYFISLLPSVCGGQALIL